MSCSVLYLCIGSILEYSVKLPFSYTCSLTDHKNNKIDDNVKILHYSSEPIKEKTTLRS